MYKCLTCKNKFQGKLGHHIYKYCSVKCYWDSLVGKPSKRRKPKIKRNGYWAIYKPEHPNAWKQGYVFEHRLVMEKHIKRYLSRREVVHHKNEDTLDNRVENLELFSSHGQHTKLAHPEIYKKQKIIFKGKHFSLKTEFKKK